MITNDQVQAAALVALAENNIPVDVQELLVFGNPMRGVAPGALGKAILAASRATPADPALDPATVEACAKVADDAAKEAERIGKLHPEDSESRSRMFARSREAASIAASIRALC